MKKKIVFSIAGKVFLPNRYHLKEDKAFEELVVVFFNYNTHYI